jgi:hypothetical protein
MRRIIHANDKPRGEGAVERVLGVDNVETADVLLAVHDDTSTTHVAATGDHNDVAGVEGDELRDLALLKVELDGVVDLDGRVRVTDRATIVGDDVRHALGTHGDLADLEELESRLLGCDAVHGETTLDVVQETEVFAGLLNRDNV